MSQLIYLYGLIPEKEGSSQPVPSFQGIDPNYETRCLTYGTTTAIICSVGRDAFSKEALEQHTKNINWVKEKAFHHHQLLNHLHSQFTVLPLKFATIFENEERLYDTITAFENDINASFQLLNGKEEWSIKLYVDSAFQPDHLNDEEITREWNEIKQLSPGKQFFAKKQLENKRKDQQKSLLSERCQNVYERLRPFSFDSQQKENWKQDVTGRNEKMALNAVYLINKQDKDYFFQEVDSLKETLSQGVSLEVTGPWPAYHFSQFKQRSESFGN